MLDHLPIDADTEDKIKKDAYYLFEFLKLDPVYKEVCDSEGSTGDHEYTLNYQHLGNVHDFTFEEWYEDRKEIFRPYKHFTVAAIKDVADYKSYASDSDGILVVAIHKYAPWNHLKQDLLTIVESALPKENGPAKGRRYLRSSDFQFAKECHHGLLERALRTYQLHAGKAAIDGNTGRINHLDIAKSIGRTPKDGDPMNKSADYADVAPDITDYLNKAKEIIEHVGRGRFPVYS